MSQLLRSVSDLSDYLAKQHGRTLAAVNLEWLAATSHPFPLRLARYYADLINWENPHDPLRLIAIPDPRESEVASYELADPIGDHEKEAVPGLIHRYPDRALLLLTTHCRMHCRFCFRRDVVGKARPVAITAISGYLMQHPQIQEIIFSGGDPFTIPVGFLKSLALQLGSATTVKTWRFHTRTPAIDPDSITDELYSFLEQICVQGKRVAVVMHVDHAREVTPAFASVVRRLQNAGAIVLSQSVLLRQVNATVEDLTALFRKLWECGVKPYYLHHLDAARGTSHFRISIAEGSAIYRKLRGNLSSLCIPEYVLDLPGGYGKIPINTLTRKSATTYIATTFEGKEIEYIDHGEAGSD